MPGPHTPAGIHLNAAGYEAWDKGLSQGIKAALCKSA
jgi:lysophospholipase L1-like esterase